MPCTDNYPDDRSEQISRLSTRVNIAEARLCQALTFIEDGGRYADFLNDFDEKGAGTSSVTLEKWWANHKEADARRKVREKKAADEAAIRNKALGKLTKKERRLLGLEKPKP